MGSTAIWWILRGVAGETHHSLKKAGREIVFIKSNKAHVQFIMQFEIDLQRLYESYILFPTVLVFVVVVLYVLGKGVKLLLKKKKTMK